MDIFKLNSVIMVLYRAFHFLHQLSWHGMREMVRERCFFLVRRNGKGQNVLRAKKECPSRSNYFTCLNYGSLQPSGGEPVAVKTDESTNPMTHTGVACLH